MYCKECGTKNDSDAKFCSKCGKKLTEESKKETPVTSNLIVDAGGIRKAMKKDAKGRVNGHLIGATAIYLVVCALLGGINTEASTLTGIITALIGVTFTFGLMIVGLKAIKGEKFEFSEVFLKPFENMKFFGYAVLLTIIICAVSFVLALIPILGWIALIVGYIYFGPAITIFIILLADPSTDKDISFTDLAKKSLEIVKGNRIEYYGVALSFIGWILLSLLTCGILFIWLTPYMQLTYINLYQKWTKQKDFKTTETGLSNGAVVGLTAGGLGCGFIIIVLCFAAIVGIFAGFLGNHINDPQIKSFIDKYTNNKTIDEGQIEDDLNDFFSNYRSNYN